jgi:hypothetical protein
MREVTPLVSMDSYNAECFKQKLATPVKTNILITPSFQHEMVVKLTATGVTALKDGKFKARMQGSRSHTLLPNATLVDNDTLKSLEAYQVNTKRFVSSQVRKKKITAGTSQNEENVDNQPPVQYRVNKKIIRARVYSYILAQPKPVLHGITISFPPCVNEDTGYRLLNTWLTVCRKPDGHHSLHLRDYLWVAERQPTTGTIHFHIMVPQYINITRANRAMQVCLCTLIRKKELAWNISAAKRYNGVDISKNRTTKRVTNFALGSQRKALVTYITKYITKNEGGFKHYAWHNSRGFSAMMTSLSLTEAEAKHMNLRPHLKMEKPFCGEFSTFIPWKEGEVPEKFTTLLRMVNSEILNKGSTQTITRMQFFLN